jgi:hypothetical protein
MGNYNLDTMIANFEELLKKPAAKKRYHIHKIQLFTSDIYNIVKGLKLLKNKKKEIGK